MAVFCALPLCGSGGSQSFCDRCSPQPSILGVISEGTEQGHSQMAEGPPFSCHTLTGSGWLCLPSAAPTWTERLQDGGTGDPGKGRNITKCKWQHSWVGRGLIQYQGGEGQEWERIILFQFLNLPRLVIACSDLCILCTRGLQQFRLPNFTTYQPACVLG